jgi:hypothetical protein
MDRTVARDLKSSITTLITALSIVTYSMSNSRKR